MKYPEPKTVEYLGRILPGQLENLADLLTAMCCGIDLLVVEAIKNGPPEFLAADSPFHELTRETRELALHAMKVKTALARVGEYLEMSKGE